MVGRANVGKSLLLTRNRLESGGPLDPMKMTIFEQRQNNRKKDI